MPAANNVSRLETPVLNGPLQPNTRISPPLAGMRPATRASRASDLSPRQQRLVRLMASLQFGAIKNLHVADGEPQFDPPPQVVREVKFGAESASTATGVDFALKRQMIELFSEFRRTGNGTIERLEIRHGLPHRMIVAVGDTGASDDHC